MKPVRRFLRQDRDYFANNQTDILRQNYDILRVACLLYLLIMAIYTVVTAIDSRSQTLLYMYIGFDILHLALCAVVFGYVSRRPDSYRAANLCRVVLELSILSFFLLEAVFPFPDQQCIYYPFPIVLLMMAFIYRPRHALTMILLYVGAFVVLVCLFKDPAVRLNDIYIASGTLVSALAGYIIVASLRHTTGGAIGRLKYLSMTDSMTGLYNKLTFESLCQSYMNDKTRSAGYALLFFDIDKFKQINDSYGHPFGDKVIKSVANVTRSTFYEKDYLCRFGGDEFVVFMVDIRSDNDVAERVRSFNEAMKALSKTLPVTGLTCSIGIAVKADRPETYAELLSRADAALYMAKASGRHQVIYAQKGFVHPSSQGAETMPLTAVAAAPKKRQTVLIVEDNAVDRQVLRRILELDYEILEATNGQEALNLLEQEYQTIAAVMLDLMMPVMDGYELLERMRDDLRLASLPVIITTGYGDDETELRALTLGANDFVVKPYRPAMIIYRLKNSIRSGGR